MSDQRVRDLATALIWSERKEIRQRRRITVKALTRIAETAVKLLDEQGSANGSWPPALGTPQGPASGLPCCSLMSGNQALPLLCTLDDGHGGDWHVAGDGDVVVGVWPTSEALERFGQ